MEHLTNFHLQLVKCVLRYVQSWLCLLLILEETKSCMHSLTLTELGAILHLALQQEFATPPGVIVYHGVL